MFTKTKKLYKINVEQQKYQKVRKQEKCRFWRYMLYVLVQRIFLFKFLDFSLDRYHF